MRLAQPGSAVWELDQENPLRFVFRPMPIAFFDIDAHLEDKRYEDDWEKAGATAFVGNLEILKLRPETRFVFRTKDEIRSSEHRAKLPASSRIVVRCGDLEMTITGDPGARLSFEHTHIAFVPDRSTSIRETACKCGSQQCENKHHMAEWEPQSSPHISLTNFVRNAVKGSMVKLRAGVYKLGPKAFKQGMYYPLLLRNFATQKPVRLADVRLFRCCGCDKQAEIRSDVNHVTSCARRDLRVTHEIRLIEFDNRRYALRPYAGPEDNLRTFGQLDMILYPEWSAHDPLDKHAWWLGLGVAKDEDVKDTIKLASCYFEPQPQNWSTDEPSEKLDWLARAANHHAAYREIYRAVVDSARNQTSRTRNSAWQYAELIASSRPWFFLLFKGPPPGYPPPPTFTEDAQYELLQTLLRRSSAQGARHYWSKE